MDIFLGLLNGMEVPFPVGFIIALSVALYFLGAKTKQDPAVSNNGIPMKNLIIGSIVSVIWMTANYLGTFGFTLQFCAMQYFITGVIGGIAAAGGATLIYEILKNRTKQLIDSVVNKGDPNA